MSEASAPRLKRETLEDGALLRLTLDAGKGNIVDRALIAELRAAVGGAAGQERLAGVILDHAGPHFSFGASVPEHVADQVGEMLPELHAAARELLALDLPVLAAVRGMCLGGGLELVLLADRVFAAEDARFGQPEIQLGVFAPIGSALLPHRVGAGAAADLLLSGRIADAAEAVSIGLVAELAADPGTAALDWAGEYLLPRSASALRLATAAARRSWRGTFIDDLAELERCYLDELMKTHDAPEGIQAFLEKRKPAWEHR